MSKVTAPGFTLNRPSHEVQTPYRNFSQFFVFVLCPPLTASPSLASPAHEDAQNPSCSWLCHAYCTQIWEEGRLSLVTSLPLELPTSSVSSSSSVSYYILLGLFCLSSLISAPPPFLNNWDLWRPHLANHWLMRDLGYDWAKTGRRKTRPQCFISGW